MYQPRSVSILQAADEKKYELSVQFPEEVAARYDQIRLRKQSVWKPIVRDIKEIIGKNRSTLVFVNSRRLCEKITFLINKDELHPVAYAHHGSLSRELRSYVEKKLKEGDLKAIVATNSLELGIDIGTLGEVVLIQTSPSISAGIQRIGRAGHDVGRTSNGLLFPTHSHDFLESAVMAAGIIEQDIESVSPVICPLDVLALIIISMTGTETWNMASLYMHLKGTYPYHDLTRDQYDLVMNMLAGRYADSRIRELKPRVSIDRLDNTVKARKGALLAVYMSGGVIPDRGYFHLRHYESHARIGELDEEFVWEAKVGQTFTLGTQNWKIERITHNDVFVLPGNPKATAPPFWIAEPSNRNFHFSDKIGRFLERSNGYSVDSDLLPVLEKEYLMAPVAARELVKFLRRQKKETGCELPHRHHILVEHVTSGAAGVPGNQIIIHTFWGGRVNRPFAMAFEAAWEKRFSQQLDVFADNNCLYFMLPDDISDLELLSIAHSLMFYGSRLTYCSTISV